MQLADLFAIERCRSQVSVACNKAIFRLASQLFAITDPSVEQEMIYDGLYSRERLGSTGIGFGVAIPHTRLKTIVNPLISLIQLENPIAFDALDGKPIDLCFTLIVPDEANKLHTEILAKLAKQLNCTTVRAALRQCQTDQALFNYTQQAMDLSL